MSTPARSGALSRRPQQWTAAQASEAGRKGGLVSKGCAGRAVIEARRHRVAAADLARARAVLQARFWKP